MTETNTSKHSQPLVVKLLVIVGFVATLVVVIWLAVEGIRRLPNTFSSLATIAENVQTYRPVTEIEVTTEETVVNSDDSFQISWTDVKQAGEYHFSYACTDGITITVRQGDGTQRPMQCGDTLSLPATVHGLFLNILSDNLRFTDVPLKVTFTNPTTDTLIEGEIKMTVVNATIPVRDEEAVSEPAESNSAKPETSTPPVTPQYSPTPVTTIVYPESNPNGFVDLSVATLGSGALRHGVFILTPRYDVNARNAIQFMIKNGGTKTSETWGFETILPSGEVYKSGPQFPLKPQEQVLFTLEFDLARTRQDYVEIRNTVFSQNDMNNYNNSSVWTVAVRK